MLITFFPFFVVLVLALSIPFSMIFLSWLIGPRKKNSVKMEPYECGVPPSAVFARGKLSVKFFIIALIFLVFDIEIAFLYPWAVVFRTLGAPGMLEMGLFIVVLLAGLIYVWKKGAFEWE